MTSESWNHQFVIVAHFHIVFCRLTEYISGQTSFSYIYDSMEVVGWYDLPLPTTWLVYRTVWFVTPFLLSKRGNE